MNKLLLTLTMILISVLGFSQQGPYSRIKIYLDGNDPNNLFRCGIDLNSFDRKGHFFISELSPTEIKQVEAAGFRYDVLIPDVQKYYIDRHLSHSPELKDGATITDLSSEWPVPANFTLGSCGGFHTLDAMVAQLDLMRSLYPNLVTLKHSLSDTITSIEGRPIYFVKISDNPDVSEPEPQVLYTGMHHAREPIGMQHLMYYMWYLLENYATNPDIKNVVDNTEMYFVPVFNVDGYQFNITTNPDGGGMWRKNRRNSGGGNYGIDINRNYGYKWGYDDEGSSPDPSSDLYRGTGPFSEPETRMMKYFCENHNFKIALNYHSYSNLFLYAWGWSSFPTPDNATFSEYASMMTIENNFMYGPAYTTIYPTNGGSDDWMYGEQTTKPKILAYTPEVGGNSDGFWPVDDNIIPLCQKNMLASLTAAKLVGKYGTIADRSSLFLYQDNGYLKFNVKRLGMVPGDFTASVIPLGNAFASIGPAVTISNLQLLENHVDSISYSLAPVNHVGDTISYILVLDNGMYTISDTVQRIFGYPFTLFSDNLNTKSNWSGTWDLTTSSYYSSPKSMTDSPLGNYSNFVNSSITLSNPVPINNSLLTVLEFRAHWALENDYDYVQLKLSENNGITWIPLKGKFTNPGASSQLPGQPLYDGMKSEWIHEAISLVPWQDKNIKLRFTLNSDGGTVFDGYYFDDLIISYLLDPTSINEKNPSTDWLGIPTPNPSNDLVRISYLLPDHSALALLSVFAVSGQMKLSLPLSEKQGWAEFSVKNWPAGIYFIHLDAAGLPTQVRKLLIY